MSNVIKSLKNKLDKLIDLAAILIMAALVLDVLWQVLSRYILKNPSAWTGELAVFLLVWAGMLGSCIALRQKAHLGIDYFVEKFRKDNKDLTRIMVCFLMGVFACLILIWGGAQLVKATFATNQYSPALGIKMGYVYLILPISGILMTIYSLEQAWSYYKDMKRQGS
jgi:TRAP-type C4-dicarboxylate transport system permease small subunit